MIRLRNSLSCCSLRQSSQSAAALRPESLSRRTMSGPGHLFAAPMLQPFSSTLLKIILYFKTAVGQGKFPEAAGFFTGMGLLILLLKILGGSEGQQTYLY